jgi:geranylgeranyl pyrophosphate synthase
MEASLGVVSSNDSNAACESRQGISELIGADGHMVVQILPNAADAAKCRAIEIPPLMPDNPARMSDIEKFLGEAAQVVNSELECLIPLTGSGPQSLRDAIRWSLFAGGKRFRPALVIAAGRAFDGDDQTLARCGAAIELLHTYSLIHDDLPSMDDDDLRRGRETCHKRFGEATAILAGDALQALSFQTIAEDERISAAMRCSLVSGLGKAAACMVTGQQLDLEAEGVTIGLKPLETIHRNKTGALIAFSAMAGGMIAGASEEDVAVLERYGVKIGLLFQIVDDYLDVTATTQALGKTAGKDADSAKATYPALIGLDATRTLIERVANDSVELLGELSRPSEVLASISRYLASRNS